MKVKIKLLSPDAKIPTYAHSTDAGADIYAAGVFGKDCRLPFLVIGDYVILLTEG